MDGLDGGSFTLYSDRGRNTAYPNRHLQLVNRLNEWVGSDSVLSPDGTTTAAPVWATIRLVPLQGYMLDPY